MVRDVSVIDVMVIRCDGDHVISDCNFVCSVFM